MGAANSTEATVVLSARNASTSNSGARIHLIVKSIEEAVASTVGGNAIADLHTVVRAGGAGAAVCSASFLASCLGAGGGGKSKSDVGDLDHFEKSECLLICFF